MADQPVYSLWLKPEGAVYDRLSGLIEELAREFHSPVFEPHVTLLGGLNLNGSKIQEKLKKIAFKPVEIQLGHFGCKDNLFQSFYLHVINDEVHQLRKQCERVFNKGGKYKPHLSLLYREMPRKQKEALANRLGDRSERFRANNMHIVSTGVEIEKWEEVERVPL